MLLGSNMQRIKRSWRFGVHNNDLEGRRETLSNDNIKVDKSFNLETLGSWAPPAMMTRFH
jgi:hypothetical protein